MLCIVTNKEFSVKQKPRPLTDAERKRIARHERMQKNRRGRSNPASIPAKLTRTSAFAPKRRGLITDSNFRRLYIVPGHSVIEVSGRELGSQHRDGLYALFRVTDTKRVRNSSPKFTRFNQDFYLCEARTTWRELLWLMKRQQHTNNLMTLLDVYRDIKKVVIAVYEGDPDEILENQKRGHLAGQGGYMGSIINDIRWDGVDLDSEVTITYGSWTMDMMREAKLVSHNADVQFSLKSDYAKSFWPYIDSQNYHHFIDENTLAALAGKDLWADDVTSANRAQFRKDCRQAFDDMVKAKGLDHWKADITGKGRKKSRRYHYSHALPSQLEMDLAGQA